MAQWRAYSSSAVSTIGFGPPDHFVQRRAGRNHGIDRVFLFHLEIDQHRPIVLARRFNRRHDFGALRHGHAADAVSLAPACAKSGFSSGVAA